MNVLISGGSVPRGCEELYLAAFLTLLRRLRGGYKPMGRFSFSLRGWRYRMTCGLLERFEDEARVFAVSPCKGFTALMEAAGDAVNMEVYISEMKAGAIRKRVDALLCDVDFLILVEPESRLRAGMAVRGVARTLLREAEKRGVEYTVVPIPCSSR